MTADNWPKHPDGRNKKIGEMTQAEFDEAVKPVLARIKADFENPLTQEKIAAVLNGTNVKN